MLSGLISLCLISVDSNSNFENNIPMDEAQLVHSLNSKNNFCHVEPGDILAEDLILDEHCHQITTGQEFHEHVKEGGVLERSVKLDEPWTLSVGENVALSADVGKLVFLVLWNLSVKDMARL
jgi:hypothetical protein